MDFDFTDDQHSLRDAVRRWVDKGFTFERRHALAKAGGATREEHAAHYRVVQRLIRARHTHAALRSDWIEFLPGDFAHDKVVRFRRWDAEGRGAVVAINFGHELRSVGLPFPCLRPDLVSLTCTYECPCVAGDRDSLHQDLRGRS